MIKYSDLVDWLIKWIRNRNVPDPIYTQKLSPFVIKRFMIFLNKIFIVKQVQSFLNKPKLTLMLCIIFNRRVFWKKNFFENTSPKCFSFSTYFCATFHPTFVLFEFGKNLNICSKLSNIFQGLYLKKQIN